MDTISAIATTASSVLGEAIYYIPTIMYAIFPPVISIICWILISHLGNYKPIAKLCRFIGLKTSQDNKCDVCWILASCFGIPAQFCWLLVTTEQPGLSIDKAGPELTWTVKVYTTLVVCVVVSHSIAAIFAVVYTTFDVLSVKRDANRQAGEAAKTE